VDECKPLPGIDISITNGVASNVAEGRGNNRPISVYRSPRRALTLCPQLGMVIQPGARFPARSADALPAILYGHFTRAIYRNRPIMH